jgi:hypothetical protein
MFAKQVGYSLHIHFVVFENCSFHWWEIKMRNLFDQILKEERQDAFQ